MPTDTSRTAAERQLEAAPECRKDQLLLLYTGQQLSIPGHLVTNNSQHPRKLEHASHRNANNPKHTLESVAPWLLAAAE